MEKGAEMKKKSSPRDLSTKDLEYGRQQVRKMLRDRSEMKKYVAERDVIWKWVVRKFAGEDLSDTIDWNPEPPLYHYEADHSKPTESRRGFICIRDHFEQSWASVVYELYNIAHTIDSYKIHQNACVGHLSKEDYIKERTKLEYEAIKKTKKFYRIIWRPWAKKKGVKTDPYYWYIWTPNTYDKWIRGYRDKSGYPWNYIGRYYDEVIVPYLRKVARTKKRNKNRRGMV